jgi:hypothetical protein
VLVANRVSQYFSAAAVVDRDFPKEEKKLPWDDSIEIEG